MIDMVREVVLAKKRGSESKTAFSKIIGDQYRYSADQALQEALNKQSNLEYDDFRGAKSMVELLKEKLILWKQEDDGGVNRDDLRASRFYSEPNTPWHTLAAEKDVHDNMMIAPSAANFWREAVVKTAIRLW